MVAYNNPPDPQANEAYYNNQYQGGYNNDLPSQATQDMVPQIILKLHSQDIIFNNNWVIIILVKFPDQGPPQAHTKSY